MFKHLDLYGVYCIVFQLLFYLTKLWLLIIILHFYHFLKEKFKLKINLYFVLELGYLEIFFILNLVLFEPNLALKKLLYKVKSNYLSILYIFLNIIQKLYNYLNCSYLIF